MAPACVDANQSTPRCREKLSELPLLIRFYIQHLHATFRLDIFARRFL
jgi:hypothetical protein